MFEFFRKPKRQIIDVNSQTQQMGFFMNAITHTIRRLTSSRGQGVSPDGKRDYNELFGYGEHLAYRNYFAMYRRGGIAKNIVDAPAKACWRDRPTIRDGDTAILVEEMQALENLGMLRKLERADIMNRVGSFAVLMVMVPDGMELDQPVGSASNLDQVSFMPFNEDGVTISEWDVDVVSRRYGMPKMYELRTTDMQGNSRQRISTIPVKVHWSRVVHMAEDSLDSDFEGSSALEAPWNNLIDLIKVRGGSGEAFFRNARRVFTLTARDKVKLDDEAMTALQEEADEFSNGWRDVMRLQGVEADQLPVEIASPRDSFDTIMEELAGITRQPIRRLLGKGAGQLAGSEDRLAWNSVIDDRQRTECSDWLLGSEAIPGVLSILAEAGLIKLGTTPRVDWPVQEALSAIEEAKIADTRASAISKLVTASDVAGETIDLKEASIAVGLPSAIFDQEEID
jgi:hypothetical protein